MSEHPKTLPELSDDEILHLIFLVRCGYKLEFWNNTRGRWFSSTLSTHDIMQMLHDPKRYTASAYRPPTNERQPEILG